MMEEDKTAEKTEGLAAPVIETARIVAAYVASNAIAVSELAPLIGAVGHAVHEASEKAKGAPEEELNPAVPVKKSVTPDYLICLEDGKRFKTLRRHLKTRYGMTPEEYREKWRLPHDYPMVAPDYAAQRAELARKIGLGRKKRK